MPARLVVLLCFAVGCARNNDLRAGIEDDSSQVQAHHLEIALAELVEKHRLSRAKYRDNAYIPPLRREELYQLREGRLFALVYPDVAQELAIPLAEDPSTHKEDRSYALYLLRILAQNGSHKSEEVLYHLASGPVSIVASEAIGHLYHVDHDGAYRKLYRRKCRQADAMAFYLLDQWVDPDTISLMKELALQSEERPYPEGCVPRMARRILKRLEWLHSARWQAEVRRILEAPDSSDLMTTAWALRIARKKELPDLEQILKRRLNAGHPGEDRRLDLIFLAYGEIATDLTDDQRQTLRHFGYECDPKERLHELIDLGQ